MIVNDMDYFSSVCWNLFSTIANLTWLTHLTMRFLYILGCSGPRCGLAGRHLTHHMQDIIPNGYSLRSWQPHIYNITYFWLEGKFFYWKHWHKVERVNLTCDVIRNLLRLCWASFEYSSLIGQCAGHLTRFLWNYDFNKQQSQVQLK